MGWQEEGYTATDQGRSVIGWQVDACAVCQFGSSSFDWAGPALIMG